MKKLIFFIAAFHLCVLSIAQETDEYYLGKQESKAKQKSDIIDKRIELLAETSEAESFDLTTVFEQFYYLIDHPINLNYTNKEELQEIYLLSDFQIMNLLAHIEKNGKLMTIYELQAITGFDLDIIQAILPFVKVNANLDSPNISITDMVTNGNHELFIRYTRVLEEMEGYSPIEDSLLQQNPNKRYLGNPDKLYMRYRFKFGTNVSIGFTGEKDPGEEFFKGTQKQGFDFYSAHAYIKNIDRIKHLAIGDYQLMFGQGLTFWSGRAFNKSADVINVKKNAVGIKPYTSVDENLFMRGVAGTTSIGKIDISGFYSRNGRDANVLEVDTSTGEAFQITSELNSGLHTTPDQLVDKNSLFVSHLGTHIAYKGRNLEIGGTGVFANYSSPISASNSSPYAQFRPTNSDQQINFGLDYNYIIRNFNFFGEVSTSLTGGSAAISGVMASIDPKLSISAIYRYYDRDYYHMMVNPFRESNARNERGLYIGAEAKPTRSIKIAGYIDRFSFPWLKFQVDAPSTGIDYLTQVNWKPSKKLEMYVRYKQETKGRNGKLELTDTTSSGFIETNFGTYDGIKELVNADVKNIRYNIKYKVSDAITLQNRVQYNRFQLGSNTPSNGYLIFQDVSYKPLSKPYSFNARFALFDTESYDSRIYAYENDVLYYFAVPAYYNRGSRIYLTFRYRVIKGIDVWLRFAQTYYNNVNSVGSGLNQINDNKKTEFRAQVRFKL
ncbi:helix-hairpin-helix domain-containing protein [Flavobacteriales bacterium]|nr:helix-hairpin-helix domain-containing protein [Flavobacteriales bacterium]